MNKAEKLDEESTCDRIMMYLEHSDLFSSRRRRRYLQAILDAGNDLLMLEEASRILWSVGKRSVYHPDPAMDRTLLIELQSHSPIRSQQVRRIWDVLRHLSQTRRVSTGAIPVISTLEDDLEMELSR